MGKIYIDMTIRTGRGQKPIRINNVSHKKAVEELRSIICKYGCD